MALLSMGLKQHFVSLDGFICEGTNGCRRLNASTIQVNVYKYARVARIAQFVVPQNWELSGQAVGKLLLRFA